MSVRQLGQSTDCLLVCLTVPLVDNMCCRLLLLLSVKAVEWFYYCITEFDLLLLLLLLRMELAKAGVGGRLAFLGYDYCL